MHRPLPSRSFPHILCHISHIFRSIYCIGSNKLTQHICLLLEGQSPSETSPKCNQLFVGPWSALPKDVINIRSLGILHANGHVTSLAEVNIHVSDWIRHRWVKIEEVPTRLEVREGSDFPRFREHIRTRLETSADGCHPVCVCWGLVGSSRYFPAGATGGAWVHVQAGRQKSEIP